MPVISSKVSQQESEAIGEFANRHGVMVSNLIRMLVVREIGIFRVFTSVSAESLTQQEKEVVPEFVEKKKPESQISKLLRARRIRLHQEGRD